MKNLSNLLTFMILISISISCNSQKDRQLSDSKTTLDLFSSISVEIPTTFVQTNSDRHDYIDTINGASLSFTMTENGSFGELLPKIDFDFLYNQPTTDSTEINKEIGQISGLEVGIIEKTIDSNEIKTFFTEINNEILMCELKGDLSSADYLDTTFDDILNSIKNK